VRSGIFRTAMDDIAGADPGDETLRLMVCTSAELHACIRVYNPSSRVKGIVAGEVLLFMFMRRVSLARTAAGFFRGRGHVARHEPTEAAHGQCGTIAD
jgi:hypothetical protein